MEKEQILKNYSDLGINTPDELYDFINKNKTATINNRNFNLRRDNSTMEFMAIFLEALDYKVTRLYFEKNASSDLYKTFTHWFLAFSKDDEWFFYESNLDGYMGQFTFATYDELIYVVTNQLNSLTENSDQKNFSLYEIAPLTKFSYKENMKESKNGVEVFVNDRMKFDIADKPSEISDRENVYDHQSDYVRSIRFFVVAFVITVVVCLFVLWATTTAEKFL